MPIFIYNIALQNTDFEVLHKSSKRFLISIFFPPVEGDAPSLSHPHLVLCAPNNNDLYIYNFVVKNEFCQSIFIYNIALQNTDFGVLQKSSKSFLISMFFPSREGGGGTTSLSPPPCLERGLRPCLLQFTSFLFIIFWNAELLCGFFTEDQNN